MRNSGRGVCCDQRDRSAGGDGRGSITDEKQKREENIRQITERLEEAFAENEEWLPLIGQAVYQYQKKTVRKMILKDHKRPDGRRMLT